MELILKAMHNLQNLVEFVGAESSRHELSVSRLTVLVISCNVTNDAQTVGNKRHLIPFDCCLTTTQQARISGRMAE